jgi:NADH-quinone oxidoreductase subunit L
LEHKYYLDDIYFGGIVRPIRDTWSAGIYWFNQHVLDAAVNGAASGSKGLSGGIMWIDRNVIDGIVNGAGTAMETFGKGLRTIQSGKVQWYAVGLFGGVIALTLFVFR